MQEFFEECIFLYDTCICRRSDPAVLVQAGNNILGVNFTIHPQSFDFSSRNLFPAARSLFTVNQIINYPCIVAWPQFLKFLVKVTRRNISEPPTENIPSARLVFYLFTFFMEFKGSANGQ